MKTVYEFDDLTELSLYIVTPCQSVYPLA